MGLSRNQYICYRVCIDQKPHDEIAYKGSHGNLGKILKHVGLLKSHVDEDLGKLVSRLIANRHDHSYFGSLIRCTVEQSIKNVWKGSGGGMLDKFVATSFGKEVSANCAAQFLKNLPTNTGNGIAVATQA